MIWILVFYFSCGAGCGGPASVMLPFVYATEEECTQDGNVWLSRNANPTRTVASFICNYVTQLPGTFAPGLASIVDGG
jgi:hypothetical protein